MKHFRILLAGLVTSAILTLMADAEMDAAAEEAIGFYKMLTVAEMVDNKCNQMPFVERALLIDVMIEAANRLPPVADSLANGDDSQTYFNVWEQATQPIREEVAAAVENFPCDNAEVAFGRPRMLIYIDIITHFQIGREDFLANASEREKANLASIVNFVQQSFSTSPEGTLDRAIAQRMKQIDYTGEQAASRTQYMLRLMFITQLMGDKKHDIRWQADSMTWGLYSTENNEFVRGYRFEKPIIDYRFEADGESILTNTYKKEPVAIIPGAQGDKITIFVLSMSPETGLQNTEATIQMGSATYKSQPALECPVDACLEFSSADTTAIRNRIERDNGEHSAPFYLNEISEGFGAPDLKTLREEQGLSPDYGPSLLLRDDLLGE